MLVPIVGHARARKQGSALSIGLRSRSRKQSAGRSHRSICYVIEIGRTATHLSAVSGRWASGIGRPRPAHPGRTAIASGRSVRSDVIVLDHVIVLGERHLLHLLRCYASYYNRSRTHLSFEQGCADQATGSHPWQHRSEARPRQPASSLRSHLISDWDRRVARHQWTSCASCTTSPLLGSIISVEHATRAHLWH